MLKELAYADNLLGSQGNSNVIGVKTRLGFSGSPEWFVAIAHFIGAGATAEFEHLGTIGGFAPDDLGFLARAGSMAELYASYFQTSQE